SVLPSAAGTRSAGSHATVNRARGSWRERRRIMVTCRGSGRADARAPPPLKVPCVVGRNVPRPPGSPFCHWAASIWRIMYVVSGTRLLHTMNVESRGPVTSRAGQPPSRNPRADEGAWANVPIWDLPERGTRGPKARYDRAAIAAAAIRIADAEGADAVTMRRVASALGIAPMSLYNYVPAKGHLVQLMCDQLAGEYTYPRVTPADKRSAIAELAGQARDVARRHPWLPGLLHRPPPPGPNGLRYLDY